MDNLGRVTIPMEMRKSLGIENRGEVEISAQKNAIMIKNMSLLMYLLVQIKT